MVYLNTINKKEQRNTMIAVLASNKKEFMTKLLTSDIFDNFLVEEATIDTFNTFHIDGKIHKDFYKNDDASSDDMPLLDYSKWIDLKSICFDLIKGKRTPLSFKFTFHPGQAMKNEVLEKAGLNINPEDVLLGLNIRFSNGNIILTTGCAFKIFSLDKTIEKAWDEFIPSFLELSNIETKEYE